MRAARARPYTVTEDEMRADVCVAIGGQGAERLVLGEVSVGARGDLQQANTIARAMVEQYGMSRNLGARVVLDDEGPRGDRGVSEARQLRVDEEIDQLLREETLRCERLLRDHHDLLVALYTLLLERKVLDAATIKTFAKKD